MSLGKEMYDYFSRKVAKEQRGKVFFFAPLRMYSLGLCVKNC